MQRGGAAAPRLRRLFAAGGRLDGGRAPRRIEDLEGRRIATSHPRIAARALAERGVSAELVQVTGSVEISPRLGLADAIIDLVSTGSTLRTNGLRSIGMLFESEAVLWERSGPTDYDARRTLTMVLGSVINARANRYLLCNVAKSRLDEVTAAAADVWFTDRHGPRDAGSRRGPRVGPGGRIWSLLPRLEAAGASSILTLPVERMVP